jgi:hypothetical protein
MVQKFRRVVTGHNAEGRSCFVIDAEASAVKEMPSMPGLALTDLWVTNSAPADNTGDVDTADRDVVLEPPSGGTLFRIVEFPPDSAWRGDADSKQAFEAIGAGHATDDSNADPMMHKTATVDYLTILKGEIWAIVDEGEVCLKQGDVMVQRGTNHSWSVRTEEPCLVGVVLVSADPVAG